jgi:HEAT repeat protein
MTETRPPSRPRQVFNALLGKGKTAEKAKERISNEQQRGNGRPTVEESVALLNAPDARVRCEAARTLGVLRDRRAVESLVRTLDDPSDAVCLSAIKALGKIGDRRAIRPLVPFLEVREMAEAAWEALRQLGYDAGASRAAPGSTPATKPSPNGSGASVQNPHKSTGGATMRDDRELEGLIHALKHDSAVERARAAKALGKRGDWRAVEPLINALHDSSSSTPTEPVLDMLGEPAVEALISSLQDADASVRVLAVMALAKIGDGRAAEPLVSALQDTDELVQMTVWAALVDMGKPAVGPLINALRDINPDVQRNAALALGELGDDGAVVPLIEALMDVHYPARGAVTKALGQIGDPQAVESLIMALRDHDILVRRRAATALGQIGDARAVEPLVQALNTDYDHIVRHSAIIALNSIVKKQADEALYRLIDDLRQSNLKVRASAIVALGWLGDKRAIEPLIASLDDSEQYLQSLVIDALRKLRQSGESS